MHMIISLCGILPEYILTHLSSLSKKKKKKVIKLELRIKHQVLKRNENHHSCSGIFVLIFFCLQGNINIQKQRLSSKYRKQWFLKVELH